MPHMARSPRRRCGGTGAGRAGACRRWPAWALHAAVCRPRRSSGRRGVVS